MLEIWNDIVCGVDRPMSRSQRHALLGRALNRMHARMYNRREQSHGGQRVKLAGMADEYS